MVLLKNKIRNSDICSTNLANLSPRSEMLCVQLLFRLKTTYDPIIYALQDDYLFQSSHGMKSILKILMALVLSEMKLSL